MNDAQIYRTGPHALFVRYVLRPTRVGCSSRVICRAGRTVQPSPSALPPLLAHAPLLRELSARRDAPTGPQPATLLDCLAAC